MDPNASHWIEGQRRWLLARGHELDGSGRLVRWRDNLHAPPSARTLAALAEAPGSPLGDAGRADPGAGEPEKPGALHRPHSGEALVLNLLEPLAGHAPAEALGAALGARECEQVALAPALPTLHGVDAGAPDLIGGAVRCDGGLPTWVLAQGCPAALDGPPGPLARAELEDTAAWRSLWGCRGLALDLRHRPGRFASLDVAGLLRAALALQRLHGPRGFRLVHLWHDLAPRRGRAPRRASRHELEIERFRMRAGGEIDFAAVRAAELFGALAGAGLLEAGHREYLDERYFGPGPAGGPRFSVR